MKHIGECMPDLVDIDLNKNYDGEKCRVCGATIRFYRNEYRKACRECGTWVFYRARVKRNHQRRVNCYICMDKGIVEYPVQKDGNLYRYVARCNCPKGMKWPGTIPLLVECKYSPRPEFIEKKNRMLTRTIPFEEKSSYRLWIYRPDESGEGKSVKKEARTYGIHNIASFVY